MPSFCNRGDILGDEILVFHRCDGMLYAHHRPDLVDAVSTSIDHDVTIDIAMLCAYGPGIVLVLGQPGYRGVAVDLCPGFARMKG